MLVRNADGVSVKKFYCSKWFGNILIKEYGIPLFGFSGDRYIFAITEKFKNIYESIPRYKKAIEGLL
jgi:hypothetical protein